jgi:murein DD-endopeptidase MepM/ murein hydrolase activator NlpD
MWLSHLDKINVKVGDNVNEETTIGTQGNTGKTI